MEQYYPIDYPPPADLSSCSLVTSSIGDEIFGWYGTGMSLSNDMMFFPDFYQFILDWIAS